MRIRKWTTIGGMVFLFGLGLFGCKSACDDLEDVCRSCYGDDRESCMDDHDVCNILPGRTGNECCEALISGWEYSCE